MAFHGGHRRPNERTPLAALLSELLEARKMNRVDFAQKIGLHKGSLSKLENRKPTKLPPGLALEKWRTALNLSEAEYKKLILAAEITCSPPHVQKLIADLLKNK
jgi:transcriptional regulator with XRE-family HTH domain